MNENKQINSLKGECLWLKINMFMTYSKRDTYAHVTGLEYSDFNHTTLW